MNKANRPALIAEIVIFITTALLLLLYFYADNRILTMENQESGGAKLDRHYAFISEDTSDLWKTVFASAQARSAAQKAYVEWIGREAPVSYDAADCMRIATASGVDGIILHKTTGEDMAALIHAAREKGIPVVTALEDEEDSERISFVGTNSYQMGEAYAQQVLSCLQEGAQRVLVISGSNLHEGSTALMVSQMIQGVEQGRNSAQKAVFETLEVSTSASFEAEEAIRDLFVSRESLPDIIVCLDVTTTECVLQALVDYNEVGNVSVIGFYASKTVEEAVRRRIIHSTVEIDAEEIGRVSIDALEEYFELGRVSNYFNIGLSVIGESKGQTEAEAAREMETDTP